MVALFIFVVLTQSLMNAALLVLIYLEREDRRKIVNEWSVRTGGRTVYREPKTEAKSEPTIDRGQFRILVPSMAEAEAEEIEPNGDAQMTEDDMAWLRKTGVIN